MGIGITLTCDKCGNKEHLDFGSFEMQYHMSDIFGKSGYIVTDDDKYILCSNCDNHYHYMVKTLKENMLNEKKKFFESIKNKKDGDFIIEEVNV